MTSMMQFFTTDATTRRYCLWCRQFIVDVTCDKRIWHAVSEVRRVTAADTLYGNVKESLDHLGSLAREKVSDIKWQRRTAKR